MNCHHLKDWIKNDSAAASVANNVENYINNNPDLSLCADICNGVKHLRRISSRSGECQNLVRRMLNFILDQYQSQFL